MIREYSRNRRNQRNEKTKETPLLQQITLKDNGVPQKSRNTRTYRIDREPVTV